MSEPQQWLLHLESLSCSEFLNTFAIDTVIPPDPHRTFLLGSLHRHITVYSQQVRAINLIHAIAQPHNGKLNSQKVAVVGAGFAGITAAAYAAQMGATVDLVEHAPRPLWLQDGCDNRWLHPRIYDWPRRGALESQTSLPVLNWRAGKARQVAARIREQWDYMVATNRRLRPHFGLQVKGTSCDSTGVQLNFAPTSGHAEELSRLRFNYVILAVGFGMEEDSDPATVSYWNDADGLMDVPDGAKVLISGYGDGGLADVLRLSMPGFQQHQICNLIQDFDFESVKHLLDWEESCSQNPSELDKKYRNEPVMLLSERLKEYCVPKLDLHLAGRGHLYGPTSAILNRFLVSQMRKQGDKDERPFREVRKAIATVNGCPQVEKKVIGYRVQFVGSSEWIDYDFVLLRHGPKPTYTDVECIKQWPGLKYNCDRWRDFPQALDKTRVPIWEPEFIQAMDRGSLSSLAAYESGGDAWCLVLQSQRQNRSLDQVVSLALQKYRERAHRERLARSINPKPLVLATIDAMADAAAYRQTIRALCRADIAVVDITDPNDPALMLLLGVRSAVKRGVTIACINDTLTPKVWTQIPFNLKELNLVSMKKTKRANNLADTIIDGLHRLASSKTYLDLPAFDYVRDLGEDSRNYAQIGHDERVLFLRPFGKPYDRDHLEWVREQIADILKYKHKIEPKIESIIDQSSPRLVGQRLYEAIRRSSMCIVDLTCWRPNVLYEFGVRLAVNQLNPVLLLDKDLLDTGRRAECKPDDDVVSKMVQLFKPFPYTRNKSNTSIDQALTTFFDLQRRSATVFQAQGTDLHAGETFRIAKDSFDTAQEAFLISVDASLESAANAAVGNYDGLQNVDPIHLYAKDNPTYGDQVRYSALERLCAAWSYLDQREAPYDLKEVDLLDPMKRALFRKY